MKFLHTADWHLGRVFPLFSEERNKQLAKARFTMVRSIMNHADKQQIGLILVCGDQFEDGEFKSPDLIAELFSIIGAFPHIKVLMIAGNHDPLVPNNIYDRIDASLYPPNLTMIRRSETVLLEEEECIIFAASLFSKTSRKNPLDWIIESERGTEQLVRIGMGHGSLAIEGKFNPDDFPIDPQFRRNAGLDYLALGHWHSSFHSDDATYYPGTPEPMTFNQNCSVLEVEIEAPGQTPTVRKTEIEPYYRWLRKTVTLYENESGTGPLIQLIESCDDRTILHLTVEGLLPPATCERIRQQLSIAEHTLFALIVEDNLSVTVGNEAFPGASSIGYLRNVIDRCAAGEAVRVHDGGLPDSEKVRQEEVKNDVLARIYDFLRGKELL